MIVFPTLEGLEVALWEVLEVEGPKAEEGSPAAETP
jgi:hypothetical protein